MKDKDNMVQLSDGDEAVCAFFIENPIALRRVAQLMPHGNPTLDFLQKLYSYAVLRNRKVDLANALLGHDGRSGGLPQVNLDWYCGCVLPSNCPEFFFQVEKYAWTRAQTASDDLDEDDLDAIEALLEWIEMIKSDIGDGIIDMECTLTRIRLKRNAIRKAMRNVHQ